MLNTLIIKLINIKIKVRVVNVLFNLKYYKNERRKRKKNQFSSLKIIFSIKTYHQMRSRNHSKPSAEKLLRQIALLGLKLYSHIYQCKMSHLCFDE